jgi:hypothetical protein
MVKKDAFEYQYAEVEKVEIGILRLELTILVSLGLHNPILVCLKSYLCVCVCVCVGGGGLCQ